MKKLFLLLLAVISLTLCASAQTRTVQGTVVDADSKEELIGVSVSAGTGYGVATDAAGHFSLKVPSSVTHLTVSYVGYQTKKVAIKPGNMNIELLADNALLDPVIVVAYGKQTKSSFTGSAATVGSAQIEKTQVTNVLDALTGKVTGLQMSNASGQPGTSSPSMAVRGFSSILAGNSPLIIVDGTPFSGDINTINTSDIESMSVLKDAASNALYGARGANGVILITTKRAKLGEATVTVDAKWGYNSRGQRDYNYITDTRQYYEQYYKALYNYATYPQEMVILNGASKPSNIGGQGMDPVSANIWANENIDSKTSFGLGYKIFTTPEGQLLIGSNGKLNPNATLGYMATYKGGQYWLTPDNWLNETYCGGLRQDYNVSIAQGTDKSNIMINVGYLSNDGIVRAPSDFKRLTGRLNADFQAKPYLKVGANVSYGHTEMNALGSEGSASSSGNVFAFATQVAPVYPLYMRDGNKKVMVDNNGVTRYDYGAGLNAGQVRPFLVGTNALSDANYGENSLTSNTLTATAFAEIRFLKDFILTLNNNLNLDETRGGQLMNPFYGQFAPQNGLVSKYHTRSMDYTFQQLLNWNRTFGKNNWSALLGHEWYKTTYAKLSASKSNIFLPSNTELDGAITDGSMGSYTSMYNNEGYFARAMYDYAAKYFASASYRRDASSRFHPKHRWGSFWSLGGAWIINKEEFFDIDWVNMLKFKLSYGEQGNDNIGGYRYTNTYALVNVDGKPAAQPDSKGNEFITWEKGGNLNGGFEFELLNARLNGSIEGFYRTTTDMLMSFPLPASSGFMGYYANVGDMMNAGLELELNGTLIKTRDFRWSVGGNLTWYKNRITRLPAENTTMEVDGYKGFSSGSTFYGEGLSMYTYLIKKYAGVDPKNGMALYYKNVKDKEGNVTVETTNQYSDASYYLCGTALAPVYGGLNTQLEYKNFDFAVNATYQIGGQVYDSSYASLMGVPQAGSVGTNFHADLANAWTPENTNTNVPRFMFGDKYATASSDRFLTDGSYFALENINFGYTLPNEVAKKLYLNKCRLYLAASNIYVWSQRQGMDPRQSFTGGSNNTYYAPIRTLSGGFTVTF